MMKIRLTYYGPVPGSVNLTQREYNNLLKQAWGDVGRYWHDKMLPKHFTREGGFEYRYKARKRGYQERKRRAVQKGHISAAQPLVGIGKTSGELRDACRFARVQATFKGVKVFLPKARKANWRHPNSQINMAEELTVISQREARELFALHTKTMDRLLLGFRKVTRIEITPGFQPRGGGGLGIQLSA